nr:MAG TPA: hypothetical protein [Caudoviricetes sp.]
MLSPLFLSKERVVFVCTDIVLVSFSYSYSIP